jgi:hypothetical protein
VTTNPSNAILDHDIPERIAAARQDRNEACPTCDGTGRLICGLCSGNGTRYPERPGSAMCWKCGGGGEVGCGTCEGTGEVEVMERRVAA